MCELILSGHQTTAVATTQPTRTRRVAVRAVEAIMHGREALLAAVGSGSPHLLGQARALVAAVMGVQEAALVTYPFTRVGAASEEWLQVGLERSGRSPGPFLVGASLPAPWNAS